MGVSGTGLTTPLQPKPGAEDTRTTSLPYVELPSNNIRLYSMDCLTGMRKLISDNSVSVVVTSPPYNIGVEYRSYNDNRPREDYLNWIEEIGKEINRVLENNGSLFLNVGGKPHEPWLAWDVANRLRPHLELQNVIHWVKSIAISKVDAGRHSPIQGDVAVGHFKPISSPRFINDCHEYIFHFTSSGRTSLDRLAIGVPYQDKSNIGRWKSAQRDLRCRGNTWFIPYKTIRDRIRQRPHPSTFPEKLPEMCIKLHGQKSVNLVLDPFLGIGTTAIASLKLGLPCLGFEIDHNYLDVARDRLTELTTIK